MKRVSVVLASLILLAGCEAGPSPTDVHVVDPAAVEVDPAQFDPALEAWWAFRARVMELHFRDGLTDFGTTKALLEALEPIATAFYVYDVEGAAGAVDDLVDLIQSLRDSGALLPDVADELRSGARDILGTGGVAGPGGGEVVLDYGAILLDVPAGAVDGPTVLTATPLPTTGLPSPVPVGGLVFDFGPDGIVFNTPIRMTIAFDPSTLPPGTDPGDLRIHKLVDGAWVAMADPIVDFDNNTVSALVDGFSTFAVLDQFFGVDNTAPTIESVQFFDPVTGLFTSNLTIDTSGGDVRVRVRLSVREMQSGFRIVNMRLGRSGIGSDETYARLVCYSRNTVRLIGSLYECESTWPQYSATGTYVVAGSSAAGTIIADNYGNTRRYAGPDRCDPEEPSVCIPFASVEVVGSPSDDTPPVVSSITGGLPPAPTYGTSLTVNPGTTGQTVSLRVEVSDDLSGLVPRTLYEDVEYLGASAVVLRSPSGDRNTTGLCTPDSDPEVWLCEAQFPAYSEDGRWRFERVSFYDRAGNLRLYRDDGSGQVCWVIDPTVCIGSAVEIDVVGGVGDTEDPVMQSYSLAASGPDVTVTARLTDNLAGVTLFAVRYRNPVTEQIQLCNVSSHVGTPLDGTWSCTLTFPVFSGTGLWVVDRVWAYDAASNIAQYTRRDSDGFLCTEVGGVETCTDFGNTDITVNPPSE